MRCFGDSTAHPCMDTQHFKAEQKTPACFRPTEKQNLSSAHRKTDQHSSIGLAI